VTLEDKIKTLNALRAYKEELLKETKLKLNSIKDERHAQENIFNSNAATIIYCDDNGIFNNTD
jgi:hypothetical protein